MNAIRTELDVGCLAGLSLQSEEFGHGLPMQLLISMVR